MKIGFFEFFSRVESLTHHSEYFQRVWQKKKSQVNVQRISQYDGDFKGQIVIDLPLFIKPSALILVLEFAKTEDQMIDAKDLTFYNAKHILIVANFLKMADLEKKVLLDIIV